MLCILCCYMFENILIPLVRAAGLAAGMLILLGDLFLSAPSRMKVPTGLLVLVLSSCPDHCRQLLLKLL